MCGRARCTLRVDDLPRACGFNHPLPTLDAERYRPSYNVSPGSYMPVVCKENKESGREPLVRCMKWGLIPSFTKKNERPDHFRMFNARSESVREKASFRRLVPTCRCLVAVEGFYEWKKDGAKKQPFYIHFRDDRPLVFAALYDMWEDSEGELLFTFTILTTRCSKALAWLHDRMPVILGNNSAIDVWLNDLKSLTFDAITQPYEASDLVWYPVTPAMGRNQFDGPECIKEIKLRSEKNNAIADLFSKSTSRRAPTRNCITEPPKAGACKDDEIVEEHLSTDEQKALLAGLDPDKEVTEEELSYPNEEGNLEQCGAKRPFHHVNDKCFSPPEYRIETITAIDSPTKDPLKEIGYKKVCTSDLSMKKKGNSNVTGEKQQTLLSYFGRS
eukprot:Gb_17169 [translate_table: standard]